MFRHKLVTAGILFCLLNVLTGRAFAVEWVPISGQVLFGSTALCSLVLANGQHMFSCSGDGSYNLTVPLDNDGLITVQVFAAGFAPSRQVLTAGEAANFLVNMVRDDTGRSFTVTRNIGPSTRSGWVNVRGVVNSNGTPVCAMVLINGQSMFSCGGSLGQYSLDAPMDNSGNITPQIFAFGFQPFRTTLAGESSPSDPMPQDPAPADVIETYNDLEIWYFSADDEVSVPVYQIVPLITDVIFLIPADKTNFTFDALEDCGVIKYHIITGWPGPPSPLQAYCDTNSTPIAVSLSGLPTNTGSPITIRFKGTARKIFGDQEFKTIDITVTGLVKRFEDVVIDDVL